MTTSDTVERDWFAEAFDALYPIVYGHRTVEAAAPEAGFAVENLGMTAEDHVLDLCCGNGRHMVHLLAAAGTVTGLDYSPDLLGFARAQLGAAARLVRGDMRVIPFQNCFDVVTNFFTSFGYFVDEEENLSVARGIARALRPGGRFFMDYLNPVHVKAHLVPESERESGGYTIREHRWIDHAARRVNKRMEVFRQGQLVSETGESVRLYPEKELRDLLASAGLSVGEVYGDYDGRPAADDRPRLIVVGKRAPDRG